MIGFVSPLTFLSEVGCLKRILNFYFFLASCRARSVAAVALVEENLEMPELIVLQVTKLRGGKGSAVVALAVRAAVIRLLILTLVADKMASVAAKALAVVVAVEVAIQRNQHVVLGVVAAVDFQRAADSNLGVASARRTIIMTRKAIQAVEEGALEVGEVDLVEVVAVFQEVMMEKTVEAVAVGLEEVVEVVVVNVVRKGILLEKALRVVGVVVVELVISVVKRDILLGSVHKQGNWIQVSLLVIASSRIN